MRKKCGLKQANSFEKTKIGLLKQKSDPMQNVFKLLLGTLLFPAVALATPFADQPEQDRAAETTLEYYGRNMLRFTPVTATDIGVGLGFSYERIIDRESRLGLIFPLNLILENNDYYYGYPASASNQYHAYLYFAPGIKIYPFGQRRVTYAVGPSLMFIYGGGKGTERSLDIYGNEIATDYSKKVFRFGVLINNYVNFQITERFNIGLEGGLGIRYLDMQSFRYNHQELRDQRNQFGFDITGQFAMTLGYRF